MASRQVQNVPPPAWVRPRSARWNAWLCASAKPGRTAPPRRVAPGDGGAPGVPDVTRPPATSMRTSRAGPDGNRAWLANSVVMRGRQPRGRSRSWALDRHAAPAVRVRPQRSVVGGVAGVDVPDDAHAGVVGEHPLDLGRGERRAVGDGHLAGVDRPADPDHAPVVPRPPGG